MADKERSTLSTLLAFAILIGLLIWLGLIFSSKGEQRLEQACKPVEYTTNFLHDITTSVLGRQPTWTLYVQQYLMDGCYYSFSVFLANATKTETVSGDIRSQNEPATGGIQP